MTRTEPAGCFVLVHGAWHGGWCWDRVAERLRARGCEVHAPTLTGLEPTASRSADTIDLSTHVADIVALVRALPAQSIVLVGHSYGGMVISAVAEALEDRIASIVFLDAFLPRDGQSLVDIAENSRAAVAAARTADLATVAPVPAINFAVNEADRAMVDANCRPQPVATLTEPVRLTGARDRIARKAYVRATGFPFAPFDGFAETTRADQDWVSIELPCGHDLMIDMPEAVADLLLQAR